MRASWMVRVGAVIDDEDVFVVGSDAGLDGFGVGVRAAVDLAGGAVDGDELVGAGGGGVDAITGEREIEREGSGPTGMRVSCWRSVEDPDIAGGAGDTPDFGAFGVLADVGDAGADVNFWRWPGERRDRRW